MNDIRIPFVRFMLGWTDGLRLKKQIYHYPEVETIRNIRYDPENLDQDHCLDLFRPNDQTGPLPVILDIHGGGLVYGDKILNQWTGAEMAQRGYVVITLNYPLIPQATIHDQLQALLDAFAFIETQKEEMQLDLTNVFLKGDSAGGLLAYLLCGLLALKTPADHFRIRHTFGIKALVLVHSMIHLKRRDLLSFLAQYNLDPDESSGIDIQIRKLFKDPLSAVIQMPPIWIVTSRNDIMFYKESVQLAHQLKKQHKLVKFHQFNYTNQPLNHVFMITHPHLKESQFLYDSLDHFLKEN